MRKKGGDYGDKGREKGGRNNYRIIRFRIRTEVKNEKKGDKKVRTLFRSPTRISYDLKSPPTIGGGSAGEGKKGEDDVILKHPRDVWADVEGGKKGNNTQGKERKGGNPLADYSLSLLPHWAAIHPRSKRRKKKGGKKKRRTVLQGGRGRNWGTLTPCPSRRVPLPGLVSVYRCVCTLCGGEKEVSKRKKKRKERKS